MLWTAEAVEDLKKLALEGKSASHISAALGVGSRNAVIGKASRIGIKLNGGGPGSLRGKAPARAVRSQWASASLHSAKRRQPWLRRCRRSRSPALAGGRQAGGEELWRSRDRRDATAAVRGDSRLRLPVAAGRSEKRRFRVLRAHAGRRAVVLRRALPNGLSLAASRDRLRGSGKGSAPSGIHGGCREAACGS